MSSTMDRIREDVQAGLDARTGRGDLRMIAAEDSPWMTEVQTAEWTGFSRSALASMRHEHRGPAFSKPGGKIRYHRDDVDAWMREGRTVPGRGRR